MSKKDYKSVFDIIGPVMIGPSSSHTAGAARIGNVAFQLFGKTPQSANFYLYESFAETYQGHGTDVALAGGLLGMKPDDDRLHESLLIAVDNGCDFRFIPLLNEPADHPNTVKIVMRDGDTSMTVIGASIGGGNIKIKKINDIDVEIDGMKPTILIFHNDRPGMIAKVSSILSELCFNISSMKVDRAKRGQDAYMVIEVDEDDCKASLGILKQLDNIHDVIYIGK